MKTLSISLIAILTCLAGLVQAQTNPPPPTPNTPRSGPAPTVVPKESPALNLTKIVERINSDSILSGFSKQVTALYAEVGKVERLLELDLALHNISQLNDVLAQTKLVRASHSLPLLNSIEGQIASSATSRTFLNRLLLETLRIEVDSYDRALKQIGLVIVGDLSDVARVERYYYSEAVAFTRELLQNRYLDILDGAYQVDVLLEEDYRKDPTRLHVDDVTREAVDKNFKDIVFAANVAHQEVASDYYAEVERIRLVENREINLLQRADTELLIDLLNGVVNFVTKYEQVFLATAHSHDD